MVATVGADEAKLDVDSGVVVMGISIGRERNKTEKQTGVRSPPQTGTGWKTREREISAAAEKQPTRDEASARGHQRNLRLAERGQQIRVRGVLLLDPVRKLVSSG